MFYKLFRPITRLEVTGLQRLRRNFAIVRGPRIPRNIRVGKFEFWAGKMKIEVLWTFPAILDFWDHLDGETT